MPALLSAMRPKQWAKNVFVLAPTPFLLVSEGVVESFSALAFLFIGFSLAASSVYLVNDTMDRHKDRLHPQKRNRAIASGRLSVPMAILAATVLTLLSLTIGFALNSAVGIALAVYLVLSHIYTFHLKHRSLVDVVMVGMLFSVRTLSGFLAVSYFPPSWELWVILAGLIAFVIELGKRKCEVQALGNSPTTRATLKFYSDQRLAKLFTITLVLIVLLYCPASFAVAPLFVSSVFFVLPGIRRYWHLISIQVEDVHPQRVILADNQLRYILVGFTASFAFSTMFLSGG